MSRREFNEHNLATIRLDQFPPDHLVDRIVGALDQNLGADAANEFPMGVSSSKMTTASTASRADKTSARACWSCTGRPAPLRRLTDASLLSPTTRWSHAPRACVSSLTCRDATDRTPIGKTNAQSAPAQFRQLLVEDRPIVDDLFLARQGRSRQGSATAIQRPSQSRYRVLPTTTDAAALAVRIDVSRSMPAASITDSVANNGVAGTRKHRAP